MYLMRQSKNNPTEDAEERRTTVKQELFKFLEEYEFVFKARVFEDNRSVLAGTRRTRTCI
jgi:hypothetical protein